MTDGLLIVLDAIVVAARKSPRGPVPRHPIVTAKARAGANRVGAGRLEDGAPAAAKSY